MTIIYTIKYHHVNAKCVIFFYYRRYFLLKNIRVINEITQSRIPLFIKLFWDFSTAVEMTME